MNLRELASKLDLSQTTVSRALNGYPEVSEATRARVKAAAQQYGYRPSPAARRLATGRSGTIGLVFPAERNMLGDLLFTEFLGGCVERAGDLGHDITLSMARGQQSEESVYRRVARSARVDAMILSSPLVADPRPRLLRQLGVPFIVHGRTRTTEPYAYLDIDNEGAFHSATRLLLDLGHRRIALVNGERHYNFAADREKGFLRAMGERGASVPPGFISGDPMHERSGFDRAAALLAGGEPPTAFLVSSIGQALGVDRAVRAASLRVGRDVALIAHDDRLHDLRAETFDPPLTTTQSSIGDAGRRIAELCITALLAGENLPQEVWPVDLVVRQSTMGA
jgi:LacI family transcriptional regulator